MRSYNKGLQKPHWKIQSEGLHAQMILTDNLPFFLLPDAAQNQDEVLINFHLFAFHLQMLIVSQVPL